MHLQCKDFHYILFDLRQYCHLFYMPIKELLLIQTQKIKCNDYYFKKNIWRYHLKIYEPLNKSDDYYLACK